MSASTYEPHRGSIPARAIAHLKSLPAGTEIASGPFADVLDVDINSLSALLAVPERHGVLRKRQINRLNHWSLGDGKPLQQRDRDEDEAEPPARVRRGGVSLLEIPAAVTTSRVRPEPAPAAPATAPTSAWRPRPDFDRLGAPALASTDTPREGAQAAQAPVTSSGRGGATPNDGTSPQRLRLALWSDGTLEIHRGTTPVVFTPDETRAIVRYLERMAESEVAA